MLEISLRSWPAVKAVWFAETIAPGDLGGGISVARLVFQQVKNRPPPTVTRAAQVSEFHTLLVDLTQEEELLWQGVQKKTRGYIRGAAKRPHEIQRIAGQPDRSLIRFVESFRSARDLGSTRAPVYARYFENGLATALVVDGATIIVHIYIIDPTIHRIRLLWSARALDTEEDTSGLNKLLHWEDMIYAKRVLGLKTYDWGGIALSDGALEGIDEFKRKFGGVLVTEYNVTWTSRLFAPAAKLLGRG